MVENFFYTFLFYQYNICFLMKYITLAVTCVIITTVNISGCCNCSEDNKNKTLTDLQKKVLQWKVALRKDEDKLVKYIKTQFKLNDKDIIRKTFSIYTDYVIETFLKAAEDKKKIDNAEEDGKQKLREEVDKKYGPFMDSVEKKFNDLIKESTNMSNDPNIGSPVLRINHNLKGSDVAGIPAVVLLLVINRENAITSEDLSNAGFVFDDGEYLLQGEYPEDSNDIKNADGK